MALPQCQNHPGVPVASITTMFPDGDTFSLCQDCYVSFCVSMAASMSGVDPEVLGAGLYQLAEAAEAEPEQVPGTAEGAPTDQAPEPAPADADDDAGEAAGWVQNGTPPPPVRAGGRTPRKRSSAAGDTGGESGSDDS